MNSASTTSSSSSTSGFTNAPPAMLRTTKTMIRSRSRSTLIPFVEAALVKDSDSSTPAAGSFNHSSEEETRDQCFYWHSMAITRVVRGSADLLPVVYACSWHPYSENLNY